MNLPGVQRRAQQRPGAPGGHRRPGRPDELAHRQRVRCRLGQPDVARHRGDAGQLEAGVPVRERDRERVIDPGIAVEDDLFGHVQVRYRNARWCVPVTCPLPSV
jgi:hypothetical protein